MSAHRFSAAEREALYRTIRERRDMRHCRELLHAAARSADVILIEGVMGLYDGSHSSADLAQRFGVPVTLVIDAAAMAQTFAAVAEGLVRHPPPCPSPVYWPTASAAAPTPPCWKRACPVTCRFSVRSPGGSR